MDSAQIFINVLRDYEAEHGVLATISLKQCDKLIERHAQLALSTDWSHADNKPGMDFYVNQKTMTSHNWLLAQTCLMPTRHVSASISTKIIFSKFQRPGLDVKLHPHRVLSRA